MANRPELWKVNGDELIYTKELEQIEEAYACLSQWIVAVKAYRKKLRKTKPHLDLKCTAWLAGFPISNIEVIFRTDTKTYKIDQDYEPHLLRHYQLLDDWYGDASSRSKLMKDYIGPSIDTGFRLTALASPRKFVVSVDLALLLASVDLPQADEKIAELDFYFDGSKELKGVLKNKPYPVFWIDMHTENTLVKAEDKLIGLKVVSTDKIKKYCNPFFEEHGENVIRPFIVKCSHLQFQTPPSNFYDHLLGLKDTWQKEREKSQIQEQAVSDKEPQTDSDKNIKKLGRSEKKKLLKSLGTAEKLQNDS